MLLWAQDGPRPANPNPPDEIGGIEKVVFHCVASNEGACATKSCLAMDCECILAALGNL